MVTTHAEETWQQLVSLRNQGRADGGGWLDHARLGFNYRIDDIRAALGIGQLEKLDRILSLRQAAAARYAELLAGVDGLELPLADDADHVRSWFVYVVTLARGTDRERVIAELERAGDRDLALPAVDPPAGVHARALRLRARGCARSRRISRSARSRSRSSPRSKRRTRNASPRRSRPRSGLGEALAVWALFGLEATATLVTYSRLPPEALYNVDRERATSPAGSGARSSCSTSARARCDRARGDRRRAEAARLGCRSRSAPSRRSRASSTRTTWTRAGSTLVPGARRRAGARVDRRSGALGAAPRWSHRARGDRLRLVLAALLLLLALPWLAAETGFYFPGDVFMGEEIPPVRDEGLAAVHLGFHHGTAGVAARAHARSPLARPGRTRASRPISR